jgi:rod shape determining protein RodA
MTTAVRTGGQPAEVRRLATRFDWPLLLAAILLIGVGLLSLFSIGVGQNNMFWFRRQVLNAFVGLLPFLVLYFVHPKVWLKLAPVLYGINLTLLASVLLIGKSAKGAARWVEIGPLQFQPSEMAKILLILTLAAFYFNRLDAMRSPGTFLLGILHILPPLLLIFTQPHLGATMVVLAIWLSVTMIAGVSMRLIGTTVAAGVAAAFVIVWSVVALPGVAGVVLDDYQQNRIRGLFQRDEKGMDWQTDRAEIAFGVGGVSGTGFLRGEQKSGFIPEQHNDFIFTLVGEEGGLIGSTLVLLLYAFLFYRIWLIMLFATDPYYRMVVAGIFALLGFHTFVNIAMVLKLLPVVGLWLPFLSYGGTAMWLCMGCIGLLLNIRRREKPLLF